MLVTNTRWWWSWSAPGVMISNEAPTWEQGVRTSSGHWGHQPGGHSSGIRHRSILMNFERDGWLRCEGVTLWMLTPCKHSTFQLLLTFCNLYRLMLSQHFVSSTSTYHRAHTYEETWWIKSIKRILSASYDFRTLVISCIFFLSFCTFIELSSMKKWLFRPCSQPWPVPGSGWSLWLVSDVPDWPLIGQNLSTKVTDSSGILIPGLAFETF